MEKYWKLLDFENQEYTTYETEEEVNHIIDFNTQHMSDDKVTKRHRISTPFSNYDFHFVSVFDEYHVHQFLYFFDTIEEQCDAFEEEIIELRTHRDVNIDEKRRQFENAYEAMESCLRDVIREQEHKIAFLQEKLCENYREGESNQLEALREQICRRNNKIAELQKHFDNLVKEDTSRILSLEQELHELQTQRDNLVNKNAELEGKLIRYAGEIDTLKEQNFRLKKRLDEIRDIVNPF